MDELMGSKVWVAAEVVNSIAARLYPLLIAYAAMATPSWESDGLQRHRYESVLWSNSAEPPCQPSGIWFRSKSGCTPWISSVTGPISADGEFSAVSWFSAVTASAGSPLVSTGSMTSFLPRMPPAALITAAAVFVPSTIGAPSEAKLPVSGARAAKGTLPPEPPEGELPLLLLLPPH